MSKIVKAINAMISKSSRISNVFKRDQEVFFLYDSKHKWSITHNTPGGYILYYYPIADTSLEDLASNVNWKDIPMVVYNAEDIKTREASESFAELYNIVQSKLYGIDSLLDEIIEDDTDLPF